jgi:uncharacterized protein (DUF427 family)
MGLSWQQGPLSGVSVGRFLTPEPLPKRLLFAEPLRRRLRVKFAEEWIADSEGVLLLHEPGRYPVAYFPLGDVRAGVLVGEKPNTRTPIFGDTEWFTVTLGERRETRGAWHYTAPPDYAGEFRGRVAFTWRAMDGFYEEDERIVGHAADQYHRNDIRQSSRHLVVKDGTRIVADTQRPLVLYESGFAPRWYVPRQDIDQSALVPVEGQTFCPYKGLASYYDIGERKRAAWSYLQAWPEVARVSNFVSFEPDVIDVFLDDEKLSLEAGQGVKEHGIDRSLDPEEMLKRGNALAHP